MRRGSRRAVLVAAGLLLRGAARRAAAGTLKRNLIAGIKTRATLSSDAAWQVAHIAAENDSRVGAAGVIVGGRVSARCGVGSLHMRSCLPCGSPRG